ncbi:MAG: sugar kinase [Chloroflexi bacterium]|nr:sugar kinase [Chloroflexota bacterium]
MNSSSNAPQVIVMGDVITDIIAYQAGALVEASDTRTRIAIRAGGSAANLATWLAASGLEVHFVGHVGNDPFGFYHRQELERFGVIPHLSFDAALSTGTIVALIDPVTAERNMLTDRGANPNLTPEEVPWDLFQTGNCFHLSGYCLLEAATRQTALAALAKARQEKMRLSVDPSSTSLLEEIGPARFLEWTRGADICFPNLAEGRLLSGEESPEAVTACLTEYYGEVVLKLGPEGALWARQGEDPVRVTALPVKIVDSTGAGDAFCAGFLAEWLRGATPQAALANGARLGAVVVSQVGARPDTAA